MVQSKSVRARLIELFSNLRYSDEYLSLPIIYHYFGADDYIKQTHIRGVLNRNIRKIFRRSQIGRGRYQLSAQGWALLM